MDGWMERLVLHNIAPDRRLVAKPSQGGRTISGGGGGAVMIYIYAYAMLCYAVLCYALLLLNDNLIHYLTSKNISLRSLNRRPGI